jgi:hypothetical protein
VKDVVINYRAGEILRHGHFNWLFRRDPVPELKFIEAHLNFDVMKDRLPENFFPDGVHFKETEGLVEPSKKHDYLAK